MCGLLEGRGSSFATTFIISAQCLSLIEGELREIIIGQVTVKSSTSFVNPLCASVFLTVDGRRLLGYGV